MTIAKIFPKSKDHLASLERKIKLWEEENISKLLQEEVVI